MNPDPPRLPLYRDTVRPEWIDYNGHMSEAFYVLVFGFATDTVMELIGVDADYRKSTGCSMYTVESHVRYLRDVPEGARLAVRTRVLGAVGKKAWFTHEMYVGTEPAPDADPVATIELLLLHVDQNAGRATPFPEPILDTLDSLTEQPPSWTGRSVGAP
ncbi:thioesterase family protein [Streptomyces sp. NPDC047081]|uniref:thioesterase family protein n=1 Tax=Streptomyces sp. NPDC047081 TaxID=3154706 RepID=UPI0033DE6683